MEKRRTYFVNHPMQRGLATRLMSYFCGTWLLVFALPICAKLLFSELPFNQLAASLVTDIWFPLMISIMLLPIVVWDSIRYSHRIAGPLGRIEASLRAIADGDNVAPIRCRNGDFCLDMVDELNRIINQKNQLREEAVQGEQANA